MLCFSLGIIFDTFEWLFLDNCNLVVNLVYMVWLRSTITITFKLRPLLSYITFERRENQKDILISTRLLYLQILRFGLKC